MQPRRRGADRTPASRRGETVADRVDHGGTLITTALSRVMSTQELVQACSTTPETSWTGSSAPWDMLKALLTSSLA